MQAAGPFQNASGIEYRKDLNCEACIRGGYEFCIWRTFPSQTTHDEYTTCTADPVIPPVHNVSTVEEAKRWVCGRAFDDQVNSIINICSPYVPEHRHEACGDYLIDLTADISIATRTIDLLPTDVSCTYRVHTKCGFPGAVYTSNSQINGQFDIAWGTWDNVDLDSDINDWEFKLWTPQHNTLASNTSVGTAHFFQDGVKISNTAFNQCTSKDRNLYVVVTRTAVITPPPQQEFTGRLLADGPATNITFTFYTHQGTQSSSIFLTLSMVLGLALSFIAMLF